MRHKQARAAKACKCTKRPLDEWSESDVAPPAYGGELNGRYPIVGTRTYQYYRQRATSRRGDHGGLFKLKSPGTPLYDGSGQVATDNGEGAPGLRIRGYIWGASRKQGGKDRFYKGRVFLNLGQVKMMPRPDGTGSELYALAWRAAVTSSKEIAINAPTWEDVKAPDGQPLIRRLPAAFGWIRVKALKFSRKGKQYFACTRKCSPALDKFRERRGPQEPTHRLTSRRDYLESKGLLGDVFVVRSLKATGRVRDFVVRGDDQGDPIGGRVYAVMSFNLPQIKPGGRGGYKGGVACDIFEEGTEFHRCRTRRGKERLTVKMPVYKKRNGKIARAGTMYFHYGFVRYISAVSAEGTPRWAKRFGWVAQWALLPDPYAAKETQSAQPTQSQSAAAAPS